MRRRYRLDGTTRLLGPVVVGGSPLKLFRLGAAGRAVVDRLTAGRAVEDSELVDALLDAGAIHPHVVSGAADGYDADDVTIVTPALGAPRYANGDVVVDDGSEQPVPGATIRLERNAGPAAARNAGLAQVGTPLVAFVDGDVELPAGWLEPVLPHFADARVGAVAPRVASRPGPSALARYEAGHSPLDLGTEPARVSAGSRVSYVPGAALVCRVEAVHRIGGFDVGLRVGEDVDLVWRLRDAGWRIRYEPASVVLHDPRPDWPAWIRQRIAYGSSAAPLAARHPGALAPLRMNRWSLAVWVLALSGRPLAATALAVGSAVALVRRLPDVPAEASLRLAMVGNLRAGEQLARAIRRAWWPVIAVAATRSTVARRALMGATLAAGHPITIADDVASSVGLWRGVLAEREIGPLLPEISSWPGRAPARRPPSADAR